MCTVPGCGKRFTEYSSLYKHHVVHTHCKPYTCNSCGKTYRQTSTLAMHKRSSHGELEATEESEQALYEQQQLEGEQPLCHRLRQAWARPCGVGERDDSKSLQPLPSLRPGSVPWPAASPIKPRSVSQTRVKGSPWSSLCVNGWEWTSACSVVREGSRRGKDPSSQANTGLLS